MPRKSMVLAFNIFLVSLMWCGGVFAQGFETRSVSDRVVIARSPGGGEPQLIVTSVRGIVVFDTFWSEITARRFRDEIAKALKRVDFAYTLNMTDRLDMFGGNAAYEDTTIIGQRAFLEKYKGKEAEASAEIKRLIDMWRWKEEVSRERLEKQPPGSDEAIGERRWMNTCKLRADELTEGFSLVLPGITYQDRMTLDLGDLTLELIWFGNAGDYNGISVARIPEEELAIIPGFVMHSQHLAPYPYGHYAELDVPRWIAVLEELLEGEDAVERVVCDINHVWSRERAHTHLEYIRKLWNEVGAAEAAGQDLPAIQDELSLDKRFGFVKDMQVYKDRGDDWIRPQHVSHVRLFFLQHKNLASEIIVRGEPDLLPSALATIRRLRAAGSDLYFDEESFNEIGYQFLQAGNVRQAIDVFKLNVEVNPDSGDVYDSLAEAYMTTEETELAVRNYEKSLELDPNNENAKEKLRSLRK